MPLQINFFFRFDAMPWSGTFDATYGIVFPSASASENGSLPRKQRLGASSC